MKLTEVEFWDQYWSSIQLPIVVNMEHSFERCLGAKLNQILLDCKGQALEIGCAPGKWMAFMARQKGLIPSGIEYSPIGVEATKKNMAALDIKYGFIRDGDFFAIEPKPVFDVVVSLGFIEHFDEPEKVIARHLQWLKPGGVLVIGVPNFMGIYHWMQEILDPTILKKHNLQVMSKNYFINIAEQLNLKIKDISQIGSFEPDLLIPAGRPENYQQFLILAVLKIARVIRRLKWWDRVNHPIFSSYILAAYVKR